MPKINQEEYEILKALDDKWEWVARDEDLSVYDDKPVKVHSVIPCWDISTENNDWQRINRRLFKFIQWEDEEPYNIQELIDEYLDDEYGYFNMKLTRELEDSINRSEETEVKKDKKWLVDKLTKERNNTYVYDPEYQYLSEFIEEVKQLDEPEVTLDKAFEKVAESYSMTKEKIWRHLERLEAYGGDVTYGEQEVMSQDWIDDNTWNSHYVGKPFVYVEDLKNKIVPQQELPAIPKFVANWIEGNKQLEEMWNDYSKEDAMNDIIHFTIYGLFADYPATNSHVELRKPVLKWLGDDRGNYFKLVNAVRYGYELEEEQKYFARIKGWENVTTGSEAYYWVYFKKGDGVGISTAVEDKYQSVSFTKHDWNNLGINEDNADFVLVEELEE